jgi:hypothetical protein
LGLVTDDDGNVFELKAIRVFHPDCTFACWVAWHTASGGDGEVSSPRRTVSPRSGSLPPLRTPC